MYDGTSRTLLIALIIGACEACAVAQAPEDGLSIDRAVSVALANNAQLKSMRAKAGAMAERPAQAWALPNPMFSYAGMDMADGGSFPNTNEKRFMLQQEFPWFGKLGLRAEVAKKDAEVMQRDVDAMSREVVMMVKEAYFDLRAVQRMAAITRSEEDVLRRMSKSAEAMNATGQRSQLDVLKAQSEITMLKPKLFELESREVLLKAKLNTLMNRDADEPVGVAVSEPVDFGAAANAALRSVAEKTRPEIRGAQIQIERAQAGRELMAKESRPDYKLGLEFRDVQEGPNMVMFTVGLELPFWGKKNHALVQEMGMMVKSGEASLEAVRRQVASEVWDANAKLEATRKTLALYRNDLLPQAESRFSASESAYQTSKADFLDLLESERFLLSVRTMTAMAEGELGMQLARLERAVGADLRGDKP